MRLNLIARQRRAGVTALGLGLLGTLVVVNGCGARYTRMAGTDTLPPVPAASVTRHVVLVSVDGLRPDAIDAFKAPTLQRLIREGSATLAASTILPSKTLPSHTSMLTGVTPDRHGVLWNNVATADRTAIELPNIFSVARAHGYRTAAFFSKAKFQPLQLPDTLDYTQAPGGLYGRWSSGHTMASVGDYLADARPNVLFVHLTDPDAAGHRSGWMSPAYGRGVLAADTAIARLLDLSEKAYGKGKFSLIVTADHGGHDYDHGSADPRDVTIPWIAWGQGVKPGLLSSASIRTMDTASTVLWLLGVETPKDWAGQAVTRAYVSDVAAATVAASN
jgi:arylsulfatase A-like enzyme